MRLGLAQLNPTVGDVAGNAAMIARAIRQAKGRGADLVAVPELAVSGYPPEDLLLKRSFLDDCQAAVTKIAKAAQGIVAVVGFPEFDRDLYNAAAIIAEGRLAATYRKHLLPNYAVFDEHRYFAPGTGNHVLRLGHDRLGISICEDIWHPAGPPEAQATVGEATLVLNISASPYHQSKGDARERMLATRASDLGAFVAFCNQVGGQDELVFDGRSSIHGPTGELIARSPQFEQDLLVADLDLYEAFQARLRDPRHRRRTGTGLAEVVVPAPRPGRKSGAPSRVSPALVGPAEVYSALVLGTRDYLAKNGFGEAVVGLSGGIDSSLVACVAADAVGARNVVGVSMPSRYSSQHSKDDAKQLADALKIRLLTIPIHAPHDALTAALADSFRGSSPNVAEENLQARVRGTILMALSNKFGWIVLTTGNKSELSTGYATLYGDMAGGFAVIKDVPKTMVYELSRFRNARSRDIPERVLVKPPSAELRPDQKDSDSLGEYQVLDPILQRYVERDAPLRDLLRDGADPAYVKRIVRMVDAAEYKRRQGAPGVRITPKAFGKDRRLPITNAYREQDS